MRSEIGPVVSKMGYKRAMFYFRQHDGVDIACLEHMLTTVGKSYGLRGVVRQLQFEGDAYFVVIEGWDYHVDRYLLFLDLSQAGLGVHYRIRKINVSAYSDMKFPDRFIFVRAKPADGEINRAGSSCKKRKMS